MASTDTTNSIYLSFLTSSTVFQERCYRRFIIAAISVTNEVNTTPNHTQRLAFAGALFAGSVSRTMLVEVILANTTNQTNALADQSSPGGAVLDSDIDFQINSTFTGIAISRAW